MPNGRCRPSAFGIKTRLEGFARYAPRCSRRLPSLVRRVHPFRSSIAPPTDASVSASRNTSRCPLQDSRPGWIRYFLSCRALASPTTCRFSPAHSGLPVTQPRSGKYLSKVGLRYFVGICCASCCLRPKWPVGTIASPAAQPLKRDRWVHQEACFGAKHTAGQPRRAIEARVEHPSGGKSCAIRRSDDEELHIVEGKVKTDGEPQRACPQHGVAHEQTQRDKCDHVPDVFTLLEEIVFGSKDERYDSGGRPEADAFPECLLEIGAEPELLGDGYTDICDEPCQRGKHDRAASASPSYDLHAAQHDHSEGNGACHDETGSRTLKCLPAQSVIEGKTIAINAPALIKCEGTGTNEGDC